MNYSRPVTGMLFVLALSAAPAWALTAQPAPANATRATAPISADPMIEGAKLCTRYMPRYERQYGIPTHLLSAIASTESGRYHQGLKIKLPWPWTINAEGKGYFFDSKAEAITAARKLRARGVQSMDVGCMQVNLYHHAQAFASLEQAFEPENNVAYAASFLRNLYQEDNSWKNAAAAYHSKTPQLGKEYVGLVYNSWYNIIDKLRAARLNVPASSVAGLRDMAVPSAPAKPAASGTQMAGYQPPRMNSISVRSVGDSVRKTHENGVMIVRPEIMKPTIKVVDSPAAVANLQPSAGRAPETMTIAQAKPVAEPAAESAPAKVIRLNDNLVSARPVNTQPVPKSGPNFIFND